MRSHSKVGPSQSCRAGRGAGGRAPGGARGREAAAGGCLREPAGRNAGQVRDKEQRSRGKILNQHQPSLKMCLKNLFGRLKGLELYNSYLSTGIYPCESQYTDNTLVYHTAVTLIQTDHPHSQDITLANQQPIVHDQSFLTLNILESAIFTIQEDMSSSLFLLEIIIIKLS